MNNSIQNSKINIFLFLLFIFITFFLILNLTSLDRVICNVFMVVSGYLCFFLYMIKKNNAKGIFCLILYALFMFALGCICKLINNNQSWQFLIGIIAYAGIAMVLLEEKISYNIFKNVYYITVVWYILRYFLGLAARDQFIKDGTYSTDMVLLLLYILMAYAAQEEQKKIGVMPVILGILPVFFSLKRMGIIIWGLLMIYQMSYDGRCKKLAIGGKKIVFLLAMVFLSYYIAANLFENYYVQFAERFAKDGVTISGLANSRAGIWTSYVQQLNNLQNLIWGVPFSNSYILLVYHKNVHNSILNCHATVGIIGLLVNVLLIIKAMIWYARNKKLYIAGLSAILLARGMSDYLYWFSWGDIIMSVLIFYPIIAKTGGNKYGKDAYL